MNDQTAEFVRKSDLLRVAFDFARAKHAGGYRRGTGGEGEQVPYIQHPVEVARLVSEAGYPEPVVAAALLHDVVEDAKPSVAPEEIDEQFGREVGTLVRALTENKLTELGDKKDPRIYEHRKRLHREKIEVAGEHAQAVFVADKLANARDVTRAVEREGTRVFEAFNVKDASTYLAKSRAELETMRRAAPNVRLLDDLEHALVALEAACARQI